MVASLMDDPEEHRRVRAEMGRPSVAGLLRGRKDTVGFGNTDGVMERVWDIALAPPAPEVLGPPPGCGQPVHAVIAPHDDYIYAGRVCRRILPMLTAKTVIVFGVLHQWRRFGLRARLVFDSHATWSTIAGPVKVSKLRELLIARLPAKHIVQSDMIHDSEHSIEALLPWLRHAQPNLHIVPVLVATSHFEELEAMASTFAVALDMVLDERGFLPGSDVAIAISADAIHYGADFQQTRFGPGGPDAYREARALDHALITGPLAGALTRAKTRNAYEAWVDPRRPGNYRWTWCGRFSIPFGLMVLEMMGGAHGWPLAYATSAGSPKLALDDLGFGVTAPADYGHFVGYPAVAYTAPMVAGADRPD